MIRRLVAAVGAAVVASGLLSCESKPELLVIGHRGAPAEALENSTASFARARDLGADGVELDVQLTADGRLVVIHDPSLDRTTTCTGIVRTKTLAELATCPLQNGEPIRTLDEVLAIILPWFKLVFVEIKVDEPVDQNQKADEAVRVVLAGGFAEKVVFTCYDETVNRRLAQHRGEGVHAAWDDFTNASLSRAARVGLDWALVRLDGIEGREGTIAHGLGQKLGVYLVHTADEYVKAENAGVDVMMTDAIRVVTGIAGRRPATAPDAGAFRPPARNGGQ